MCQERKQDLGRFCPRAMITSALVKHTILDEKTVFIARTPKIVLKYAQ